MGREGVWILRCEHRVLMLTEAASPAFPRLSALEAEQFSAPLQLGMHEGVAWHAADVEAFPALPGAQAVSLREVFMLAGDTAFAQAGRATQLLDWQRQHRFCGQCGTPTARSSEEFAMHCPACGLVVYPRISPAIMVLVRDGGRLLLARSPRFKPGVYSALAGFVEPGETLEQCAVREVREEVGIEIANLRYFASQPWPFPNSLMIAFFADYAGGELVPEPGEIEVVEWFTPERLPLLPDPVSISRRLIEAGLSELGATGTAAG